MKTILAATAALLLSSGIAFADGPDFSIMDAQCRANPELPCASTAALTVRTGSIEEVANKLSLVLPVQLSAQELIEINGWNGANPTTTIPAGVRFRVMG